MTSFERMHVLTFENLNILNPKVSDKIFVLNNFRFHHFDLSFLFACITFVMVVFGR